MFKESISSGVLCAIARNAWRRLRFENPQIVVQAEYVGDQAYMTYEIPKDELAIDAWLSKTLFLVQSTCELGFSALHELLLQKKIGLHCEPSFLLLNTIENKGGDKNATFKRVEFMLNVDHQVTDGIGIRILLDLYLSILAESLSGPKDILNQELDWRSSAENLSTSWVTVMNGAQEVSGTEYEKLMQLNQDFMFNKLVGCTLISFALHTSP